MNRVESLLTEQYGPDVVWFCGACGEYNAPRISETDIVLLAAWDGEGSGGGAGLLQVAGAQTAGSIGSATARACGAPSGAASRATS